MKEYLEWFCSTLISSDWRTWNTVLDAERGLFISWPLTAFLSAHAVLLFAAWHALADWLVLRKSRAWWFAEGFAAGAHARAVNLAQIKYSKDPKFEEGCILWQHDEALADEAKERFDDLCGILGAECAAKERKAR